MPNIISQIEKQLVNRTGSKRPIREQIEEGLDNIPSGPYGKFGKGDVAGIVGYALIKTGQLAVLPIPGVRQPGFHSISQGVEDMGDFERHTININAASKTVAQVASEYEIASPSNIDYITSDVQAIKVEEVTSRPTSSTWRVTVDVADRGVLEDG